MYSKTDKERASSHPATNAAGDPMASRGPTEDNDLSLCLLILLSKGTSSRASRVWTWPKAGRTKQDAWAEGG